MLALLVVNSACRSESASWDARDLPLALQRSVYLRLADIARDHSSVGRDAEVLCIGIGMSPRNADPDRDVVQSVSVDSITVIGWSGCFTDSLSSAVYERASGRRALLLLLLSANVLNHQEVMLFVEWHEDAMSAEDYRCQAVRRDGRWELNDCVLTGQT
jgi:hypothetical protein